MARRSTKKVTDEDNQTIVEESAAGSAPDIVTGYEIGNLDNIDMNTTDETEEKEVNLSEYEELDDKSALAKKIKKNMEPTDEEADPEQNLDTDDEFLQDSDFEPEEKDAQYFD
ncbi:MAG: hypothetical protein JNK26_03865 [Candidatus Doudnabacteria bacterium]|nr:hypothetical protein [Candidatus Doudnabacteria bacterium]